MNPRESALPRPVAMHLDAVDFCRAIAGRPASTTVDDLPNTEVPY